MPAKQRPAITRGGMRKPLACEIGHFAFVGVLGFLESMLHLPFLPLSACEAIDCGIGVRMADAY